MCWSGEASAMLATSGFATASYLAYKGETRELWVPLTYFACMELLQAATYVYIDQCDTPQNQLLTWLGYLHITFQPFFVNMVALYFIPEQVKRRIGGIVYALCGLASLAMLLKLYPFSWARTCIPGYEGFCGQLVCSTSGDWHIAWQLPLNGLLSDYPDHLIPFRFGLHGFAYFAASFFLPFLYGSWRFVALHLVVGPLLADILTRHPNEHAAVWCLLSIGLCVSVIKTPLRRLLRVARWPGYRLCMEKPLGDIGEGVAPALASNNRYAGPPPPRWPRSNAWKSRPRRGLRGKKIGIRTNRPMDRIAGRTDPESVLLENDGNIPITCARISSKSRPKGGRRMYVC